MIDLWNRTVQRGALHGGSAANRVLRLLDEANAPHGDQPKFAGTMSDPSDESQGRLILLRQAGNGPYHGSHSEGVALDEEPAGRG